MFSLFKKLFPPKLKFPQDELKELEKEHPDPRICCGIYKDNGCAHVDGPICIPNSCTESLQFRLMKFHRLHTEGKLD